MDARHLNDLLPLPYTEEALAHVAGRIVEVQDFLGRRILIENLSSYVQYRHSTIPEWEFLAAVADAADCDILLDVNNIYVSSRNHGFDAAAYLRAMPAQRIAEIHLAGHSVKHYDDGEILIDTHDAHVCDEVWALYRAALAQFGARPTLVEWDSELPPLALLVAEADIAAHHLDHCHDAVAA